MSISPVFKYVIPTAAAVGAGAAIAVVVMRKPNGPVEEHNGIDVEKAVADATKKKPQQSHTPDTGSDGVQTDSSTSQLVTDDEIPVEEPKEKDPAPTPDKNSGRPQSGSSDSKAGTGGQRSVKEPELEPAPVEEGGEDPELEPAPVEDQVEDDVFEMPEIGSEAWWQLLNQQLRGMSADNDRLRAQVQGQITFLYDVSRPHIGELSEQLEGMMTFACTPADRLDGRGWWSAYSSVLRALPVGTESWWSGVERMVQGASNNNQQVLSELSLLRTVTTPVANRVFNCLASLMPFAIDSMGSGWNARNWSAIRQQIYGEVYEQTTPNSQEWWVVLGTASLALAGEERQQQVNAQLTFLHGIAAEVDENAMAGVMVAVLSMTQSGWDDARWQQANMAAYQAVPTGGEAWWKVLGALLVRAAGNDAALKKSAEEGFKALQMVKPVAQAVQPQLVEVMACVVSGGITTELNTKILATLTAAGVQFS